MKLLVLSDAMHETLQKAVSHAIWYTASKAAETDDPERIPENQFWLDELRDAEWIYEIIENAPEAE